LEFRKGFSFNNLALDIFLICIEILFFDQLESALQSMQNAKLALVKQKGPDAQNPGGSETMARVM